MLTSTETAASTSLLLPLPYPLLFLTFAAVYLLFQVGMFVCMYVYVQVCVYMYVHNILKLKTFVVLYCLIFHLLLPIKTSENSAVGRSRLHILVHNERMAIFGGFLVGGQHVGIHCPKPIYPFVP